MTPLLLPGLGLAFAAPWGLALGALAAAALVALHAITVGRARPAWLPTARFAPERPPRAARRIQRPRDLALLALRVLAALAAGAALARPVAMPERRAVVRVVLADQSRAADPAAVRAAAHAALRPGDVLLPFAATPRPPLTLAVDADSAVRRRRIDSALNARPPGVADDARASLSAALVAARRLAPTLAPQADSLELVLVSPLVTEAVDAATPLIRAAWTGRARVVPVPIRSVARSPAPAGAPRGLGAARGRSVAAAVALRGGPPDDALAAALALADVPAGGTDAPVRVVRDGVTGADRAWVRAAGAAGGRVLLDWPADGVPTGARRVSPADTAQALVAASAAGAAAVAVAPFTRRAALDAPLHDVPNSTSMAPEAVVGAPRVVARWADGRPAAVERPAGSGCERLVAVAVPQAGDAALRPGFRALLPTLLGPCGGTPDFAPLPPAAVARLVGGGPLLAAAPLRARLAPPAPDRLGAALLGVALLALVAELALRRGRRAGADQPGAGADDAGVSPPPAAGERSGPPRAWAA